MATKLLMAKSPEEAAVSKTASAAFVAGGTEVNRLGSDIAEKSATLISLKRCSGLDGIEEDAGYVTIGAMCTFQDLVESGKVPGWLKEAALFMASRTKRNMATIGGNIAAKRSDSYLIPALSAAGAVLELLGSDAKTERIGIAEYLDGAYDDKLIVSVTVEKDVRLCDLEKAFNEDPEISEDKIIEMVKTCTGLHTADDMFGSDAYKRYLIAVTAFDLFKKLKGKEV